MFDGRSSDLVMSIHWDLHLQQFTVASRFNVLIRSKSKSGDKSGLISESLWNHITNILFDGYQLNKWPNRSLHSPEIGCRNLFTHINYKNRLGKKRKNNQKTKSKLLASVSKAEGIYQRKEKRTKPYLINIIL